MYLLISGSLRISMTQSNLGKVPWPPNNRAKTPFLPSIPLNIPSSVLSLHPLLHTPSSPSIPSLHTPPSPFLPFILLPFIPSFIPPIGIASRARRISSRESDTASRSRRGESSGRPEGATSSSAPGGVFMGTTVADRARSLSTRQVSRWSRTVLRERRMSSRAPRDRSMPC